MSLIECPECKKEISDKASSCPNCGCPITPELIEKEKRIKKMMMLRMERQNRKLAQENENRKKWKELGYDGISLDFVENSLSKEQIEKLFSDKILSKKFIQFLMKLFQAAYQATNIILLFLERMQKKLV